MLLLETDNWPLWIVIALFTGSAMVIAVVGVRLAHVANRLADSTGLGEALFGAVLLGGSTSLSGSVTSMTAAWQDYPELAVSNGIGGILVQTFFLSIADISYRRANLEHAAASIENLIQCALLIVLLSLTLVAAFTPAVALFAVHPVSLVLIVAYLCGLHLVKEVKNRPLWRPLNTEATRQDIPETGAANDGPIRLWGVFVILALIIAVAGYTVAQSGIMLVNRTFLSETVVGALFTATATSLPELVTTLAAVRQGALTLAVGGIIGGNSFDALFLSFSDFTYRSGSIYHAMADRQVLIIVLGILMSSILMLGLVRREKHGIANIGFESMLVMLTYIGAFLVIFLIE